MSGRYQHKDHLHRKAKDEGWRSRASYKLLELQGKKRLVRKGNKVIDLGCAPGGWLQVVAREVKSKGFVVGIDLEKILEFTQEELGPNAARPMFIQGDFRDPAVRRQAMEHCSGKAHVILSDMSPKLSGVRDRDIVESTSLAELALEFANEVLRPGGSLVVKTFPSPEADQLFRDFQKRFRTVSREHLDSTRKSSNELYILGRGFLGSGAAEKDDSEGSVVE